MKDVPAFCTFLVLDASLFEQYNVNGKCAYGKTSRRRNTCIYETKMMVGCSNDWKQTDLIIFHWNWKEKQENASSLGC